MRQRGDFVAQGGELADLAVVAAHVFVVVGLRSQ